MTAKNEISEELKGLSEVVAGIDRQSPLEAPDAAYFESLPGQVLMRLGMELEAGGDSSLSHVLQVVKKENTLSVPEGYFDNFAALMLEKARSSTPEMAGMQVHQQEGRSEAAEELAGLSPLLLGIGKKMPFQVPEDYFGTLSVPEIPETAPFLAELKNKAVYEVPERYFEGLAEQVLSRINADAAVLEGVLGGATGQQEARVIPMTSRPARKRWLNIAGMSVAASVLLVVGWLTLVRPGVPKIAGTTMGNADISKDLSKVSDTAIANYLDVQHPALDEELSNSTAAVDISATDLGSMLGEVSDAELKEYMEDHGYVKDLPTN